MQNQFNEVSTKIVNFDEYRENRFKLEQKQLNWKEKLFQVVDDLYSAALWVRRGFGEAVDQWKGRPKPAGDYYYDQYDNRRHAPLYMDRETLEGDLAYFTKHGLNKEFQEKSAKIARQAFEMSRDYGVLAEIGQLKKYEI